MSDSNLLRIPPSGRYNRRLASDFLPRVPLKGLPLVRVEPILRPSLVDVVVERIRQVIDEGGMSSGDRLPSESELVESLRVSRTVLREAIGRLETMGLLTVRRGRGMFVGDRSSLSNCAKLVRSAVSIAPRELIKITEFRAVLECYATRQAAKMATADDLAELEGLLAQMDRPGLEYMDAIEFDFEFHRKLVEITGNELMVNVMQVVRDFVIAAMVHTTPKPREREETSRFHLDILEGIRVGDPDAAEEAMQRHMDALTRRLHQAEERRRRNAELTAIDGHH